MLIPGARALATAAGKLGTVQITSGTVTIVGVRALATAIGKVGAVRLIPQLLRAAATGTGKPSAVQEAPAAQRATATAIGRPGAIVYGGTITGTRALATAAGKPGAVRLSPADIRGLATGAGRPNANRLSPAAQRAVAIATGRAGFIRYDITITGTRALATCIARPGTITIVTGAAQAGLTDRTRSPALGSVTIVTTSNGRGRARMRTDNGRTLART